MRAIPAIAENERIVYSQFNRFLSGPIKAEPAVWPKLYMAIYKVNCKAEILFQQHCIPVANKPMAINTKSKLNRAIYPLVKNALCHKDFEKAMIVVSMINKIR